MASFLLLGAAWAFFQGKDGTASVASFSAGLILLGAWLATAIVDWHGGHEPRGQVLTLEGEVAGDDPDA
jgi:hypothetical protein